MRDMGIRHGSKEQALPLIVGKDTVYVRLEIEKVLKDNEGKQIDNLYRYHEFQYGIAEYITLISEANQNTESTLDMILTQIIPSLMV